MIILDEQLLGRGLEKEIARWYPGRVQFIVELRPGTVIKDDAIPALLRQEECHFRATAVSVRSWERRRLAGIRCSERPADRGVAVRGIGSSVG